MSLETFEEMYALMKASTGDKATVISPNDFASSLKRRLMVPAKTRHG